MEPTGVLADLAAEEDAFDAVLLTLPRVSWDLPTPAAGWSVRDQVAHLAFSEDLASLAASDPAAFDRRLAELLADLDRAEREPRERAEGMSPQELLAWWRRARIRTWTVLERLPSDARVPWVVGDMGVASFASARLMETWAHGQDVVDAVGAERLPTARVQHIADLGVRTRDFSYQARGREMPEATMRVSLTAPDGSPWVWGPPGADAEVAGPALDFCLVVTQRRHVSDTRLILRGTAAEEWMAIAQAFAGPPTDGPRPGRLATTRGPAR